MQKTKMQQIFDAPKGGLEYNPTQSFALQVFWVVRSPTAAMEMIQKGFNPCSKATLRDTPTTLMYFFRIARDQRIAEQLKNEVKTIGQHPHYQSAFKSIEMGIPKQGIEMKMKFGAINCAPLSWGANEPISGHEKELDFDPIVLECTEVYLDDRAFYHHASSHDWMKSSPEILKPVRSLKPTTFCIGNPTEGVWEKTLDSYLKANRITNDGVDGIAPGVFIHQSENKEANSHLFMELDFLVKKEKIPTFRAQLDLVQKELGAPCLLVIPTETVEDSVSIRAMISVPYSTGTNSKTLGCLKDVIEKVEGRVYVFDTNTLSVSETPEERQRRIDEVQLFVNQSGLKLSIVDGKQAEKENTLAGYTLHPLFRQLIPDENFKFQM